MRLALPLSVTLLAAALTMPLSVTAAHASAPAPIEVVATADRALGLGGPAAAAPLLAEHIAVAPDGAVLFFDIEARQVRRVDPATGTLTALAGSLSGTAVCPLSGAADPLTVPLGAVRGLWATTDGSVLLHTCGQVVRLDPNDNRWHTALTGSFTTVAYTPSGDAVAFQGHSSFSASVLRRVPAGSAPDAAGTVLATDVEANRIAVAPDGTPYVATGTTVSRVNPDGTVTRLAGTGQSPSQQLPQDGAGQPATEVPLSVDRLTVAPDGGTVYFSDTQGIRTLLRAVSTAGGALRTVAGPAPRCWDSGCLGTGLAVRGTELLSVVREVRAFNTDGSTALPGTLVAGLPTGESPDGTTLTRAFFSQPRALAPLPDGQVAIATALGIRTLTGTDGDSVLGTRVAGLVAYALAAGPDGTLYAETSPGGPAIIQRISPSGATSSVAGGGSAAPVDGAVATSVRLNSPVLAVDPVDGTLLIAEGPDVFALTGETLTRLASMPTAVSGMVVRADQHVVVAFQAAGFDLSDIDRTTSPATVTRLECAAGCPSRHLVSLPNGGLVGWVNPDPVLRAPDGTVTSLPATLAGNVVAVGSSLFRVSGSLRGSASYRADNVPLPTYTDAPAVEASPGPGRATITVTPKPGVTQRVQVWGASSGGSRFSVLDATTDGSGSPLTTTVVALGSEGLLGGQSYTFTTVVSEAGVSAVANIAAVTPLPDTSAPGAPGLALAAYGGTAQLSITFPADDDVRAVIVRKSDTGAALTDPTAGVPVGTAYPGYGPLTTDVDPLRTTQFAAFTVDHNGNGSPAVTAVRPAATLVAGAAVSDVGVRWAAGTSQLTWPETTDFAIRWAAGTTAPAGPTQGSALQHLSGGEGATTFLPLATGAKAAISIFSFTSGAATSYRRTSLVITGGSQSDLLTVSPTAVVNPGTRPAVSVRLIRTTTIATHGLAGRQISLYRRTVGTAAWTVVAGQTTTSTGVLAFTVPAVTAATEYQARYPTFDSAQVIATGRTTVRQLLTETLSATTVRRGTAVYARGTLNPKRAVRVYLQKYVSGRWINVTSAVSTSTGVISVKWIPTVPGAYTLRLLSPATSTLLAGNSPSRVLRVT